MAPIAPPTGPPPRWPHEQMGLWIGRRNQSREKKSWQRRRRPPPFSRRSHATVRCKRCASPKMLGILAILQSSPGICDRFTLENRSEFINGRNEIIAFLSRKWVKEFDYRLIKEMWAFTGNRIAVR